MTKKKPGAKVVQREKKERHNLCFTPSEWSELESQKEEAKADSISGYIVEKLKLNKLTK